MRKLASIREISAIHPIPGADRIEVAQVDGWECVVQKGEFQVGQHIVYVEVDSIVPDVPEFEFLRPRKFRVRTIKLRGQVSQGLVLPLSILPDGAPCDLGDDVTEVLHITKYDPEAQQEAMLTKQPKQPTNPIVKYLMYPHVRERFKETGLPLPYGEYGFSPNAEQVYEVDKMLCELSIYWSSLGDKAGSCGMLMIESCAEPGLTNAAQCGCISLYDLNLLGLHDEATPDNCGFQRKNCLCYSGKTELLEHKKRCGHQCLYCYWR